MGRNDGALWVVGSLLVAGLAGCTSPPAEPQSLRWECPYYDEDGNCSDEPTDAQLPDDFEVDDAVAITPDDKARERYLHLAPLDPALVEPPLLFGDGGSDAARRLVEDALKAGHRPQADLLRPDRLIAAYAAPLRAPATHPALMYAEGVVCPWDPSVVLVVLGVRATQEGRAPLRRVQASVVWSWVAADELRHSGDGSTYWRRQDATPWSLRLDELAPGEQRVSMFEVRPYDWDPTQEPAVRIVEPKRELPFDYEDEDYAPVYIDHSETLGTVKLRYVDHHGTPGEMSGRLKVEAQRWKNAGPNARMAVATLAWARKLRGDEQLRETSWRTILRMVPREGVPAEDRDALVDAIKRSRAL